MADMHQCAGCGRVDFLVGRFINHNLPGINGLSTSAIHSNRYRPSILILLLESSTQSEYDWVVGVWTTDTGYWLFAPRKSTIKTQSCNEWKYCIKCPRTHALRTETARDNPCTSYLESRRALPTTHDFDDFDSYFSSHIHPLPPRSTYFSPTNSVLSLIPEDESANGMVARRVLTVLFASLA